MSSRRGEDWSKAEVEQTVADYFDMLQAELLGRGYSKTDHRRKLLFVLGPRSEQSVEFKHQNISAILIHAGYPYIDGYKPKGNYQTLLSDQVQAFLQQHPGFFESLADVPVINPDRLPAVPGGAALALFDGPPERMETPNRPDQPWLDRRKRQVDFVRRDAQNRKLGRLGEQFVVDLERRRLAEQGRDDLARRVEWVADTCGDGTGFDVLSFDDRDDSECYVEVKTTGLGKFFPFCVTANEARCSEACSEKYRLYRVFQFSRSPRVYVLPGALSRSCRLEPTEYRAVV
jgi:hypothetical protein